MAINIKALRDQRAEKAKEARNLLDQHTGNDFTKDIEAQVDALYEEIDRIDAKISRAEKQAKLDGDAASDDRQREAGDRARAGMTPEQREQQDRYSAAFRNWIM